MATAGLGVLGAGKPLKVSFPLLNKEEEDVWVGRGREEGKERGREGDRPSSKGQNPMGGSSGKESFLQRHKK